MKISSIVFCTFFSIKGYSQTVIDYNNFNVSLATKALEESYLNYRDTISHFGDDPKYSFDSLRPELNNVPKLRRPKKSNYLYENYSYKNCLTLLSSGQFYHIDVKEKFKSEQKKFILEAINNVKNIPDYFKGEFKTASYSEVLFQCKDLSLTSYEELADYIIKTFEKSPSHCSILRGGTHSYYLYSEYKITDVTGLFSCCVLYDKSRKRIVSAINIVTM
jgi:hypothetical protein